jgi:predicted permease
MMRRGLDALAQDVRFGYRAWRRNAAFAVTTIAVLAFGLSATILVFGIASELLLKRLAVSDPSRVVRIFSNRFSNTPYDHYLAYRDGNRTLSGLGIFAVVSVSLRTTGDPQHVIGMTVSGNYFDLIGVRPAVGRTLTPADDRPNASGAAVISHEAWQQRFASDPSIVGRAAFINGAPFTIVGVMREGYRGEMAPFAPEVWVPWNAPGFASASDGQRGQTGPMIGRLGAGVSLRQAQAEFSVLAASLPSDGAPPARVTVYPAFRLVPELASSVGLFAGFLLALVALALAITCVNLANLLLARWAARRHEIAVRLALGASRRRIVRQLLAETLLLAAAGSALGWALASAAARLLARQTLSTPVGPAGLDVAFDWRVFVFATAAMAGTTLAFGLLPALQSSSVPIRGGLTPGERAGGPLRTRMRMLLVSGQVALCATLLIVAALLLRGLQAATEIDRGFEAGHVLTASVDLTVRAYSSENGIAFYSQLSDRLEQLPGVTAVNLVDIVPLTLSNQTRFLVREGDALPQDGTPPPVVHTNAISPGHFRALAIPRLAGRDFDRTDTPQSTPVAIVNETLARLLWPGQQAVGRRVQFAGARTALAPAIEIVGVVRDSKYVTVGENPRPFLYRPLAQSYTPRVTLLVKTAGDPMSLLPVIRTELRRLDPDLPLYNAAPLDIATAVSRCCRCASHPFWRRRSAWSRLSCRRRGSTGSSPTSFDSAAAKSAFGWLLAPLAGTSHDWSAARVYAGPGPGSSSDCRWRSGWRSCCERCFTASVRATPSRSPASRVC